MKHTNGNWYKVKLDLTGEVLVMIYKDGCFATSENGTKFNTDDLTVLCVML